MKKPNITEGEWEFEWPDDPMGLFIVKNEDEEHIHDGFNGPNAKAISSVPNAVSDYASLIHAINDCKTDSGAVILGDKLEESIFKTAKKMGFEI